MVADPQRPSPLPAALTGLLLLVAISLVVFWLWPRPTPSPPTPNMAPKTEPSTPQTKPLQAPVETTKAGPQPTPAPKMIRYPDGTEYPPLNGVTNPPPCNWPANIPYSPVVGKFTDSDGLEWYRHADGNRTTVQMMWRNDLRRMDAQFRSDIRTNAVKVDDGKH
jgi:hypothetical protein